MIRVAYLTSEVYPFSKTGGLADVAHSLTAALNTEGIPSTVLSPFHRSVREWIAAHGAQPTPVELPGKLTFAGEPHAFRYQRLIYDGTPLVFVQNDHFFDRPQLYVDADGRDYADSVARFAFFCQAALTYCESMPEPATILHVNDWQTALAPIYLKTTLASRHTAFRPLRTVLTVHNMAYQGLFPREQLPLTGLGWNLFHPEALEFYDHVNLLKGGIIFADVVTTVSPTYAEEIQTEAQGAGLHGVMQAQRHKLTGILNGIDVAVWNPQTDPHIPAHYERTNLGGKAVCKSALQQRMRLPVRADSFLLGVISRLDRQKGIDLVIEAMLQLTELDVQLVTLGTGARDLEESLRALAATRPERVSVVIGFDEALAHLIEAGADAFLMPSAYEPCGLNQMYSQRYGTVPIVRETGGLSDTVVDHMPKRRATGAASGFTFKALAVDDLVATIRRAERLYRTKPEVWRVLITHVMGIDHSWRHRAREYAALYARLQEGA